MKLDFVFILVVQPIHLLQIWDFLEHRDIFAPYGKGLPVPFETSCRVKTKYY